MSIISVAQIMRSDPDRARLAHDKKYDNGSAFVNGEYCAFSEAQIPLTDLGFLQSDVTYEKVTVSNGRFFRLQDHMERFERSCATFRLQNPYTNAEMADIFANLVRLTGMKEAGVFWCLTRGLGKSAKERNNPDIYENRFYAAVDPYSSIVDDDQRRRGIEMYISREYIRIPPKAVDPTAKNFHCMDMKLSLFEARDKGKEWSVLTDAEGYLTEAPGANIFIVKGNVLYTPDSGCLEGITRKTAIELAEMIGISTRIEKVHADQLKEADDAFITSTAGGIMPINSVDDIVLGGIDGPGKLSAQLHNMYWEKMWEGWKSTPIDYAASSSESSIN